MRKSRFLIFLALIIFLGAGFAIPLAASPAKNKSQEIESKNIESQKMDPNEIVRKADEIRVPKGPYLLDITVIDFKAEEKRGDKDYRVYTKDLDHSLVEFLSPATERGKSLLLLEDDVWIYLPKLRKPVRVPLRQRLLGQVAIGDMVRINYAHDYNATLVGEKEFKGTPAFVLNLEAKTPKKTYQKIKYLVAKKSYRPLYAEFFTAAGTSLKSLTFEDFRLVEGKKRPMKGVFRDTLNKDKVTHLKFNGMTRKPLQDMIFSKTYMRTFE